MFMRQVFIGVWYNVYSLGMLRPKAEPPVTSVPAAREVGDARLMLRPKASEGALARSAESQEHRGKRPPKTYYDYSNGPRES